MQLNFDNYLDKMRGCWNGKNIGGTLGAPFEGMRGVFDVRYYTVFQNSLIRAYVDGHEAPYISEGTVKKITITFENLQRRQQRLTLTLHTPEGWEVQPGKTLAVNLEQGHCNVPLARVTLEITPHALSRARNDLMLACELIPSKGEGRRLVQQGGVMVNDQKVSSIDESFTGEQLREGLKIRKGKKVFHKAILK